MKLSLQHKGIEQGEVMEWANDKSGEEILNDIKNHFQMCANYNASAMLRAEHVFREMVYQQAINHTGSSLTHTMRVDSEGRVHYTPKNASFYG